MNAAPTPVIDAYPLGRSESETRRLILQHQIYSPITRRLLTTAGIGRGMNVLDLGSGAGDVSMLVADLVGPEGHVRGIDANADIIRTARRRARAAGWTNVEFVRGDIEQLDLDDEFDAVVGRWILMYAADPVDLLRHVVDHVRPSGIVAFQESADLTKPAETYPPVPLHERLARWIDTPADFSGMVRDMGLRLYRTFIDAGLPAPQLASETPVGGGPDWAGYAFVAESMRSLQPLLLRLGNITTDEVADIDTLEDRLRAEVVERHAIQSLPTVIGAWTRRPVAGNGEKPQRRGKPRR
jgi:SAM-dependent methyltransferase